MQVWPAAGELAARSSAVVTVELSGTTEKELAELVRLEVRRAPIMTLYAQLVVHIS